MKIKRMLRPWLKEGDYVESRGAWGPRRWGKIAEVVWGDYGSIGTEVSHYMVELVDGTVVKFEWIDTWGLSALEVLARL
jgi:hypothetical protein